MCRPLVRPPISTHSPVLVCAALKDCRVGKRALRCFSCRNSTDQGSLQLCKGLALAV